MNTSWGQGKRESGVCGQHSTDTQLLPEPRAPPCAPPPHTKRRDQSHTAALVFWLPCGSLQDISPHCPSPPPQASGAVDTDQPSRIWGTQVLRLFLRWEKLAQNEEVMCGGPTGLPPTSSRLAEGPPALHHGVSRTPCFLL